MEISEKIDSKYVSPECFHAYVSAEMKVPNTLIAVGPYVGHAALKTIATKSDITSAVNQFANTYSFSREQMDSVTKAVVFTHGKFGVLVLPDGAVFEEKSGIRFFKLERFEVVYMEGVKNILQSILLLHGVKAEKNGSCEAQVAKILGHPDKLATTIEVFAAAEHAINSAESTKHSEVFKAKFNFTESGEQSRPMFPAEKDAIQTEAMPFIIASVREILNARKLDISAEQLEKFVFILTSPELYDSH